MSSETRSLHGKFVIEHVFTIGVLLPFCRRFLVLAGRVVEGELRVGDVLKTPDGRLLVIKSLEKGHRKVEKALANEPVGVQVEGLGWKPKPKDLEKYSIISLVMKLRREAEEKYSHIPKDARSKLVESEVKSRLEREIEKIAFEAYSCM